MKNLRILLDCDEVLADFVGGVCQVYGVPLAGVLNHWERGVWDVIPPLSRALGYPATMTEGEFWSRLDNEDFWVGLQPLPWFKEVITLVNEFTDDWHVISSPSWSVSSYVGKVRWLKNAFGQRFDRFAITPHKYLFANPNTMLIDDRETNVLGFIERGGRGLIFPKYHNRFHGNADNPVGFIRDVLEFGFIKK